MPSTTASPPSRSAARSSSACVRGGKESKVAVALETAPETPRDEIVIRGALAVPRRQGRQPVAGARRRAAARRRDRRRGHRRRRRRLAGPAVRLPARRHRLAVNNEKIAKTRDLEQSPRRRAPAAGAITIVRGGQQMSRACSADELPARQTRRRPEPVRGRGLDKDAPRPLADRLRPQKLAEVVGQDHLLGPDGALTRMLDTRSLGSLIFWGPPGTGKTTVARLLAHDDRASISSRSRRSSPASPTSRKSSTRRARGARPGRARCCSSTRSTASTARSRTASCR